MSKHLSEEQLGEMLLHGPATGSVWRHIKSGNLYTVRTTVIIEATLEVAVVYSPGRGFT